MKTIIVSALAILFTPLALAQIHQIPDISTQVLKQVVASRQATLLDISGPADFKAGHIPGAVDFVSNKDSLAAYLPPDKTKMIVVYCHTESCPDYTAAAGAAIDLGYPNVRFYEPGLPGWKKSGGRVETGASR